MSLISKILPSWKTALLAILAAVLLIVAFPDFEWWFTAWFALVPLMWAVEREKESVVRSFVVGWLFGTVFFFGTCWWLTFAPINYAGFPPWLAYSGMAFVAAVVGLFPALFAGILAVLLRRFGSWGFLAAPFVWVFTEFLRYWLAGNNWNAIGYSQAFVEVWPVFLFWTARLGGVLLTGAVVVSVNCLIARTFVVLIGADEMRPKLKQCFIEWAAFLTISLIALIVNFLTIGELRSEVPRFTVIAVQPNVPMSYLDPIRLEQLRERQINLAEAEIAKLTAEQRSNILVVFPESPMNFMYTDDREFQKFIGDFTQRNNVSVLFNSAEPDSTNAKYFNSAVMVGSDGRKVDEYDKIYLLPFGEAIPSPLDGIMPGFVGNFSYGREYDLFPVGDAKAGVMICFESHFGALSREYVRKGADVLIEMTNDGYLGPTPVLRQHLANAVFRAVETKRPVLRATNVGITVRINQYGDMCDSLISCGPESYTEGASVWSVSKSDGSQTFYVKYGDWFAWLCSAVTLGILALSLRRRSTT
ncbi:MAG: apolipoprotein N-acyltransferase [Pyrinomonadaceae bacterium]